MNHRTVAIFGLMLASNARVSGMTAENQCREARGDSPGYVFAHFLEEAQELEKLAAEAKALEVEPITIISRSEPSDYEQRIMLLTATGRGKPAGGDPETPGLHDDDAGRAFLNGGETRFPTFFRPGE